MDSDNDNVVNLADCCGGKTKDKFRSLLDSVFKFRENLDKAIDSFTNDPPDSDFQYGYLNALVEVRNELILTVEA